MNLSTSTLSLVCVALGDLIALLLLFQKKRALAACPGFFQVSAWQRPMSLCPSLRNPFHPDPFNCDV